MNELTLTVTTQVKVPLKRIADLLIGAFEGGSNYWIKEL